MNKLPFQVEIRNGIPPTLPATKRPSPEVAHAPKRILKGVLTGKERILAIKNALRYFPETMHKALIPEFKDELDQYGRIYMYRFMPEYEIKARPIEDYPARSQQAAAIMLMIQNNLDHKVAKYPEELITYGGNGAVFQNWAQYRLCMKYLSEIKDNQTLVLYSGHPLGIFPSSADAPRIVVSNGMMIPNYSSVEDWNKYNALGVTQYGQMTAGSFMYIGPQGIVHGTTITLLNAGRLRDLGEANLHGRTYVTSGLGGMSGAQALAAEITGACGIIAEVDPAAIEQRLKDGYVSRENIYSDLGKLVMAMEEMKQKTSPKTLVYAGNIVDLWEYFAENETDVDLGSDQTSCHNIQDLGYIPVGYTFAEAKKLLVSDKEKYMEAVDNSLVRHVDAINKMAESGMYFWDYGNAFLKVAGEAGAEIWASKKDKIYRYKSYVEEIMGPLCFDYGFGPFRWVCTSGKVEDLRRTDRMAAEVLKEILNDCNPRIQGQLKDNIRWIENAEENIPIVGSHSRILYADAIGRIKIAQAFNQAITQGKLSAPVVLGRDHHDVSGTDSPFRETSNIYDGSKFTADMAIQNVIGDSFRGATWVSIHNGGGVGWGEVINGGFGLVLDGSKQSEDNLQSMLYWDVNNGIARRSWARNEPAMFTIKQAMEDNQDLIVTMPSIVDHKLLDDIK